MRRRSLLFRLESIGWPAELDEAPWLASAPIRGFDRAETSLGGDPSLVSAVNVTVLLGGVGLLGCGATSGVVSVAADAMAGAAKAVQGILELDERIEAVYRLVWELVACLRVRMLSSWLRRLVSVREADVPPLHSRHTQYEQPLSSERPSIVRPPISKDATRVVQSVANEDGDKCTPSREEAQRRSACLQVVVIAQAR